MIALLKFLKLDPAKKRLPHPSGLLPTIIPTSSIALANEEVKTFVTTGENKKERGPYVKLSNEANLLLQGMQLRMILLRLHVILHVVFQT